MRRLGIKKKTLGERKDWGCKSLLPGVKIRFIWKKNPKRRGNVSRGGGKTGRGEKRKPN